MCTVREWAELQRLVAVRRRDYVIVVVLSVGNRVASMVFGV